VLGKEFDDDLNFWLKFQFSHCHDASTPLFNRCLSPYRKGEKYARILNLSL